MNNSEIKFKDLLVKTLSDKKGKFNSKFLFKQLKVKNNELIDILSDWINELIKHNKIDIINLGKDKKDEIIYMTKDHFIEKIKKRLLALDFLLDENATFSLFTDFSETDNPNTDFLVDKIQLFLHPLVKFDKGSRNVPIMFNLFKIFVPERMINISDQMIEKIDMNKASFSESKEVKKMMFKNEKQQQNYSIYQIILTAVSYILLEKGKLVLTKKEIIESRGYKVFFNTPDFSSFTSLIKKIYTFNPYVNESLISFYPENWLDINQLKKQIKAEESQEFLKQNFPFLEQEERFTLIKAFNLYPASNKKEDRKIVDKEEIKKEDERTVNEQVELNQKSQKMDFVDNINHDEILYKENSKSKNQKKKKPSKSQPLNFLDEMIYKENENQVLKEPKEKKDFQVKEKDSENQTLLRHINQFDKSEKHFLLCILDSTKVKSGYYSHSKNDEHFQKFIGKITSSNLFEVTEENEKFLIKRNPQISEDQYIILKNKLEESIMNLEKNNNEQKNSLKESKNITKPTKNENDLKETAEEISKDNLLNDLLINDTAEPETKDESALNDKIQESHDEPFIIENKNNIHEETQFNLDDVDHKSFFEISKDTENKKEEEENFKPKSQKHLKKNISEAKKPMKENEHLVDEAVKQESLEGKIISVLTDNQEKWLQIKLLSDQMGFELRDGLAYKPEIAVFDDGFSHLEPIARNTGAVILQIDEFMRRLGLRDTN